ncbi:MAG: glycosyltransferase family 2 protein, partial [Rectinema sp.]|nr:glycosyltransferase family 2 protein [Rectinema sp.]
MTISPELLLALVIIFLWLNLYTILATLLHKCRVKIEKENLKQQLRELPQLFMAEESQSRLRVIYERIQYLAQNIIVPLMQRQKIFNAGSIEEFERTYTRRLRSKNRLERMDAARKLSGLGTDRSRKALESALLKERDFPTKLYLANALADIHDERSISTLVKSLENGHFWYRHKVNMLIASYGLAVMDYARGLFWRSDVEIRELLVDLSGAAPTAEFKDYLLDLIRSGLAETGRLQRITANLPARCCYFCIHGRQEAEETHRMCPYKGKVENAYRCFRYRTLVTSLSPVTNHHRLVVKAADTIARYFPQELAHEYYLEHPDRDIQSISIQALGRIPVRDNAILLTRYLERDETAVAARAGLREILNRNPQLIPVVIGVFKQSSGNLRTRLAEVLSSRIEYIISKLIGFESQFAEHVIHELISLERVSELVEFLKRNRNPEIEDKLISIIDSRIEDSPLLAQECGLFLPDRLLEKLGIQRITRATKPREEKLDKAMVRRLYVILAFAIGLFPLLYILKYYDRLQFMPPIQHLKYFVINFNTNFAYYAMTVNFIYIFLLVLSRLNIRRASRLWDLKSMHQLFKPRMLPSVSIIAPAFNEQSTIIESVNSLLNLKYPDYELVVVNDGSRDETLRTVIEYFDLKKTDYYFQVKLKHYPIRGIYTNPSIPKLVVVDKENGGKADSLNAGINVASKEYVCGIDADSLLEPEALLRIASLTLDYGVETPGLGGNVFPINGCSVDRGKIERIAPPKKWLARLQTVEYLRAFMCGRLGWDYLNSLLIISGAFGLFRKERVVSVGGYLTSSGQYQKDTVGEDMELVVRIARHMNEKKLKYRIAYAFNANCWTEVPEEMKNLRKQRNRWHRGLIDIMLFHSKTIFNPFYGRMGLVGMPYYLIFEMVGPLFEIQGYIMVGIAALFGLLSPRLALLLFFATILLGIYISVASVKVAEHSTVYYTMKD